MKITTLGINVIRPYWRNPRKIDKAVDAVKKSIEEYGFNSPIIVDSKHVIIAGHTRYRALRELGWKDVPVIVKDLSPDKAREYRIADNRTSDLAEWDWDSLIPELREVGDIESFNVYFPDNDLGELLEKDSGGVSSKLDIPVVTADAIRKSQDSQESQMEDGTKSRNAELLDVSCPHCGGQFAVNPGQANSRHSQ